MTDDTMDTFEQFFPVASTGRGASYKEARDAILAVDPKERPQTLVKLKAAGVEPDDWEAALTAQMISGWMTNKGDFIQCAAYMRGSLPGPPPLPGFTSQHRADAIATLGEDVIPRVLELLWKAREYGNDTERGALFGALCVLKDDRAVMPAIEMSEETEPEMVQIESVNLLSVLADSRGFEPVLDVALDLDRDEDVRATAIRGLAEFDDPRAAKSITEILENEERSLEDRRAAADALQERADPESRGLVARALADTDDEDIQLTLISTLGEIGTGADIPSLEHVAEDGSRDVKQSVRHAIRGIRARERKR
ncbi:MAG: HEAT repeat domain-containing protein [Phycisphaerae bacterium]